MLTRSIRPVLIAAVIAAGANADVRVRHMFSTGPAPGLTEGVTIDQAMPPSFPVIADSRGRALAIGHLAGTDVTAANDTAMWLVGPGQAELLVRDGDALIGFSGGTIAFFYPLGIASDDTVFLRVQMAGMAATSDTAIAYVRPGEAPVSLLREGDPIPGRPGQAWPDLLLARGGVSRAGDLVFLTQPTNGMLVAATTDSVDIVFATGDPVPDFEDTIGVVDGLFAVADGPIVHFSMRLSGPELTTANDNAIYDYRDGVLRLLAREGDPAPGLPDYAYRRFQSVGLADTLGVGGFSFSADLGGPGGTAIGLFRADEAGVAPLGSTVEPIPGLDPTATFADVFWEQQHPAGLAFIARDNDGGDHDGVWLATDTGLANIVRQGDTPPGSSAPFTYGSFRSFGNYGAVRCSSSGRIAFLTAITDPADDGPTVYGTDPLGNLRRGMAAGDLIDTPTGPRTLGIATGAAYADDGGIIIATQMFGPAVSTGLVRLDIGCPGSGCDDLDIANSDCRVDLADLALLISEFGLNGRDLVSDIDRNGAVDLSDLASLIAGYGSDCD
ncbi:MAG: hypothetical protein KDA32_09375 [Phycisphaerales bacterium]|nr:hypothetical protein [Phycisphaerales bacterium]